MPCLDNHVMMTLKLGQWSQDHALRAFEIEREIAATRHCSLTSAKTRKRWLSLGKLKRLMRKPA